MSEPRSRPAPDTLAADKERLKTAATVAGAAGVGAGLAALGPKAVATAKRVWHKRNVQAVRGTLKAARAKLKDAQQAARDVVRASPAKGRWGGWKARVGGAALAGGAAYFMSKGAEGQLRKGEAYTNTMAAPPVKKPPPGAPAKRFRRFKQLGSNRTYFRDMWKSAPKEPEDRTETWARAGGAALGGGVGWAAGAALGQKYGNKAVNKISRKAEARALIEMRRARLPQKVANMASPAKGFIPGMGAASAEAGRRLLRAEARLAGRVAGFGAKGALLAGAAGLGSIAGDALGDLAAANARRAQQGKEGTDEVRRLSMGGMAGGLAVGAGAQLWAETRRRFRYAPGKRALAGIAVGGAGAFAGERAGEIQSARMSKRSPGSPLSAEELEQRREAAKARWANHIPKGDDTPKDRPAQPERRAWSGNALGVSRGVKTTSWIPTKHWDVDENRKLVPLSLPEKGEGGGKTFRRFERKPNRPADWTDEQFIAFGRGVNQRMDGWKDRIMADIAAKDRKRARPVLPANPDPWAVNQMWNLARAVALNNVGLVTLEGFNFQPEHIARLKPYERFGQNLVHRLEGRLRHEDQATWAKLRAEFGQEKADGAVYLKDTTGGQKAGEKRKTFPRHSVLVKRWAGALPF